MVSSNNKKAKKDKGTQGFLRDLMKTVGLRGNPAVIDMTSKEPREEDPQASGDRKANDASTDAQSSETAKNAAKPGLLPPTLVVSEIICTPEEKDTYTYYILNRVRFACCDVNSMFGSNIRLRGGMCGQFSGRTLIFSNSIEGVKKINNFLSTLRLPAKPLHAQVTAFCTCILIVRSILATHFGTAQCQMQQRQRLKTMDFFRENENAILVATDVAARGLDFPDVQVCDSFLNCNTRVSRCRAQES